MHDVFMFLAGACFYVAVSHGVDHKPWIIDVYATVVAITSAYTCY